MLDSPKEWTGSEELPLSNSHEQVESLWVKIKDKDQPKTVCVWCLLQAAWSGGSADTDALLQICWQLGMSSSPASKFFMNI